MKRLASYSQSDVLMSGIFPGINVLDAPLWTDGYNIEFRSGGPRHASGYVRQVVEPNGLAARYLAQTWVSSRAVGQQNVEGPVLCFTSGIRDRIYAWFGGTDLFQVASPEFLKSEAGALSYVLDITSYGQFFLFGTHTWLFYWDPYTKDWVKATEYLQNHRILKVFNNHLLSIGSHLYGKLDQDYEITVRWASLDTLTDWEPQDINSAGFLVLRGMESPIRAAAQLGDMYAIYSDNKMHVMYYVGAPYIFGQRFALEGIGALSDRSVVSVGRLNFGLGPRGVWETDGNTFRYIDDPAIRQWILDNVRRSGFADERIVGYHNVVSKQVIWSVALEPSDLATAAIGFNYETGAWTRYAYGFTGALAAGSFGCPILAGNQGEIFFAQQGVNSDGAAMPALVRTKPLDLGDPNRCKYVEMLAVRVKELSDDFKVNLGFMANAHDAIEWSGPQTVTDRIYVDREVGYLVLEFSSNALDVDWLLTGFDVWGEVTGVLS